jgi:hypothetical protein
MLCQRCSRPSRQGRGPVWSNPWTLRSCTRPCSPVSERLRKSDRIR